MLNTYISSIQRSLPDRGHHEGGTTSHSGMGRPTGRPHVEDYKNNESDYQQHANLVTGVVCLQNDIILILIANKNDKEIR